MPIETRAKSREPTDAFVEYAIHESTEKTVKLNIPEEAKSNGKGERVFIKCKLLDISVLGCAIDSPYLIPTGVYLDVKIDPAPFVAETKIKHEGPINAVSIARSCLMREKNRYRLGVEFTTISKEDKELIESFISHKERRRTGRWDMTK